MSAFLKYVVFVFYGCISFLLCRIKILLFCFLTVIFCLLFILVCISYGSYACYDDYCFYYYAFFFVCISDFLLRGLECALCVSISNYFLFLHKSISSFYFCVFVLCVTCFIMRMLF